MRLLPALLRHRAPRHYVLVDEQGCCRMLFSSTARPQGPRWVEVVEVRLGWIGRQLPADATRAA